MDPLYAFLIYLPVTMLVLAVAVPVWAGSRPPYSGDRETRRWAARAALAAPLWPIAIPAVVLYGLARLARALWRDATRKDMK